MAKKKNFGIKNFFFSFAIVCIVIYIFQNINSSAETMVAENGNLEEVIKADGIVIKDEKVYNASLDGSVTYYYENGTKIKEGKLVADLNTDTNSATINKQIIEIQTAIDLKKSTTINSVSTLSNDRLLSFENEIQASILNNELNSMYNIVGQLNNNTDITSYEGTYEQYNIEQLETMKNNLASSISTHKVPYYSGSSGLISYKIDGLENEYNFENVLNITPSSTVKKDYLLSDKKQKESVVENEEIFKIIKNFEYYIVVTVDNEKAKLFTENKYIKTRVLSDGESHEVWGFIKKINYGSEQSVLILYFDDYFYKIYDNRYVDIELITDTYEGLKINIKALTNLNGLNGVYVQDASNIIKFFPVEILGKNEENAIISAGEYVGEHDRKIIRINDKAYSTVKIFDKIILEPDNVYDGQIVD